MKKSTFFFIDFSQQKRNSCKNIKIVSDPKRLNFDAFAKFDNSDRSIGDLGFAMVLDLAWLYVLFLHLALLFPILTVLVSVESPWCHPEVYCQNLQSLVRPVFLDNGSTWNPSRVRSQCDFQAIDVMNFQY